MKVSYDISVEGDPLDGYDLMIDGKIIKHFDKDDSDYLANNIVSDIADVLESTIESSLDLAKKSVDTFNIEVMTTEDIYELETRYGIESSDKIYDRFSKMGDSGSGIELGLRLDRVKGKIYVTMVNGVMLEQDAELLT